jgi:hypothetical protein
MSVIEYFMKYTKISLKSMAVIFISSSELLRAIVKQYFSSDLLLIVYVQSSHIQQYLVASETYCKTVL